jgi:hypothetical protein
MWLADKFAQVARSHPRRQRLVLSYLLVRLTFLLRAGNFGEKIVARHTANIAVREPSPNLKTASCLLIIGLPGEIPGFASW